MNPPPPAAPPRSFPPPLPAPPRALAAGERLLPTLLAAGALVVVGDFLLWGFTPGLALALFTAAVAVLMVLRHGRAEVQVRVLVPLAMLLASAGQMAVEASFTNVAVITALFAILMGELCYAQLAAGWARWSESVVAWLCAAGRWAWLMRALNEQPLAQVDWREQQFRRDRYARELFAWAEPLGELTSGERESAVIQDYYRTLRELGMIGRSR